MLTLTHVSEQAVHMSHPLCLGLASTSKTVCLMSNKTRDFLILVVSTLRECPPVEECSNKALADCFVLEEEPFLPDLSSPLYL